MCDRDKEGRCKPAGPTYCCHFLLTEPAVLYVRSLHCVRAVKPVGYFLLTKPIMNHAVCAVKPLGMYAAATERGMH